MITVVLYEIFHFFRYTTQYVFITEVSLSKLSLISRNCVIMLHLLIQIIVKSKFNDTIILYLFLGNFKF